jgi:hypothetical protein
VSCATPGPGPASRALLAPGEGPCNPADLALPFGVLDLSDINAFVDAFVSQRPRRTSRRRSACSISSDINLFASSFLGGLPLSHGADARRAWGGVYENSRSAERLLCGVVFARRGPAVETGQGS